MSLMFVLVAWAVVLVIPAIIKIRNGGIVTSVTRFHDQLIVLGRTSTTSYPSAQHVHTTQTFLVARSSGAQVTRSRILANKPNRSMSPAQARQIRERELRQRRSLVLFSLVVLCLVSAMVTLMAASPFTVGLTLASIGATSLYVYLLVQIQAAKQRPQHRIVPGAGAPHAPWDEVPHGLARDRDVYPALARSESPTIRRAPTFASAEVS